MESCYILERCSASAVLNCQLQASSTHRVLTHSGPHGAGSRHILLSADITRSRLTCFRWHLDVFFLHLGDNRTFHLTIAKPTKSSNPVPEHWWASLIEFYWQVHSTIHRGNVSSASVTILDERGALDRLVLLYSLDIASPSSLGGSAWGGGKALDMLVGDYRRVCPPRRLGFSPTNTGNIAPEPPSPVAGKSSLLHQQHGESRR